MSAAENQVLIHQGNQTLTLDQVEKLSGGGKPHTRNLPNSLNVAHTHNQPTIVNGEYTEATPTYTQSNSASGSNSATGSNSASGATEATSNSAAGPTNVVGNSQNAPAIMAGSTFRAGPHIEHGSTNVESKDIDAHFKAGQHSVRSNSPSGSNSQEGPTKSGGPHSQSFQAVLADATATKATEILRQGGFAPTETMATKTWAARGKSNSGPGMAPAA